MAKYDFEIAFRDTVKLNVFRNVLSRFLCIPAEKIVEYNEYWELSDSADFPSYVGIQCQYSEVGLQTLVNGLCFIPLEDDLLGELAFFLACELQTETVIGDYAYPDPEAQDRSLAFFPNGCCCRAISTWDYGCSANDIDLTPVWLNSHDCLTRHFR